MEERDMSRARRRDLLTSEDLHCSLMFKLWLIYHKNKFFPLSLLHAEELCSMRNVAPSLTLPNSMTTSGMAPI